MSNYILMKYMLDNDYVSENDAGCIAGLVILVVIVFVIYAFITGQI